MDGVLETCRFGPLTITFGDGVLRPRPWTLAQSEWAIQVARDTEPGPILELCAGAGHIGLVAAHGTRRGLVQVEADKAAAKCARHNAAAADVEPYELRVADLSAAITPEERFPIILADPPYVPSDEVDAFPEDPRLAIDGGPDGLDVTRVCLAIAARALTGRGALLLQVRGETQAKQVDEVAREQKLDLQVRDVRAIDENRAVALLGRATERKQNG